MAATIKLTYYPMKAAKEAADMHEGGYRPVGCFPQRMDIKIIEASVTLAQPRARAASFGWVAVLATYRVRIAHGVVEVDPRPLPPGTPAAMRYE